MAQGLFSSLSSAFITKMRLGKIAAEKSAKDKGIWELIEIISAISKYINIYIKRDR